MVETGLDVMEDEKSRTEAITRHVEGGRLTEDQASKLLGKGGSKRKRK